MCDEDSDSRKYCDSSSYQFVPDADREMAVQALQEFEQQNYEQSLSLLKKLISKRPKDSKVFHNYCVAEYYLSSCKKTDQFNKKIADLSKQAHIDIQSLESLDDIDNCVVLHNQSVALYHFHQYHSAIYILDKHISTKESTVLGRIYRNSIVAEIKNCNKSSQIDDKNENGMSEALRRKLQLCKARCYAMMKTSKACKKEIKNLLSSGSSIQNIPAFYLKSQLEYQRGNYRKALKLLNSVTLPDDVSKYFWETGDCLPAIFYNNVGCIHFYMGKPNLGHFYTKKALTEFESEIVKLCDLLDNKHSTLPLHLLNISIPHQLMYNIGVQYLQAKSFFKAFTFFVEVVKSYHSNPRLWLRIAECCIHINKQTVWMNMWNARRDLL
ncbi:CCR4-NOT transcription complex subunit 10-A [Trichonephila clavata]|uniref:CCR4-NOT transcription complex subunit 10 n=1 Tax=Trichonephila clavata TaxID=2740835 RepID=A0A8X6GU28_TRICU|nr:CCR4-NOT transcription complex subunit 10-A [Trichonephila clavata]